MSKKKRTIFFISDSTGITANVLGHSLLTQFDNIEFEQITLPYINTIDKVKSVIKRVNDAADHAGESPIVFSSMLRAEMRQLLTESKGHVIDLFGLFINELEGVFQQKASSEVGRSHRIDNEGKNNSNNASAYERRIDAVNFALQHDDGATAQHYEHADVILIGVSRCGKTPTSLFLAMQFGIFTANYPLTEEDVSDMRLPKVLVPYRHKLFGLTIKPERLQQIRQERRPNSRYSSLKQCQLEVQTLEALYRRLNIPYISTTTTSVEEIATMVLDATKLERRIY